MAKFNKNKAFKIVIKLMLYVANQCRPMICGVPLKTIQVAFWVFIMYSTNEQFQ